MIFIWTYPKPFVFDHAYSTQAATENVSTNWLARYPWTILSNKYLRLNRHFRLQFHCQQGCLGSLYTERTKLKRLRKISINILNGGCILQWLSISRARCHPPIYQPLLYPSYRYEKDAVGGQTVPGPGTNDNCQAISIDPPKEEFLRLPKILAQFARRYKIPAQIFWRTINVYNQNFISFVHFIPVAPV